jgi:hypothetical protein
LWLGIWGSACIYGIILSHHQHQGKDHLLSRARSDTVLLPYKQAPYVELGDQSTDQPIINKSKPIDPCCRAAAVRFAYAYAYALHKFMIPISIIGFLDSIQGAYKL